MRSGGSAESYLHRYAKATLASWLRSGIRVGPNFKGLQPIMGTLGDTYQRNAPMYGIYTEYPIATGLVGTVAETTKSVGRSRLCADAVACSHLTSWHCFYCTLQAKPLHRHGIPTIKELKELKGPKGLRTNFVFDIAMIGLDGSLKCVFEVCHTNPIEQNKIRWLSDHGVPWYELSADWIMKQCRSPYSVANGIVRQHAATVAPTAVVTEELILAEDAGPDSSETDAAVYSDGEVQQ